MRNELLIGGRSVDTIEGLDINITKEVYSISDPSQRKSDFTKTVKIPGSKVNDNIFASLFDVNFSIRSATQLNPDFNPAKKASCAYFQDELQQIKGYCQLEAIVILENNKVEYHIVIYGFIRNLFSDISNLTLNDLTTLGTADWTDAEIIASWTDVFDPVVKPCYPYLNRGKAVYNRFGSNAEWSYAADAFKPWLYVKHILNAIIHEAGYTIEESAFFETEQFKRLIIECDIKKFVQNQATIASTLVEAIRNTNQVITPVSNANATNMALIWDKQIVFNTETADPANQFDTTTGTLTMANAGYTNLESTFDGTVDKATSNAGILSFLLVMKRGGLYFIYDSAPVGLTGSGVQALNPVTLSVQGYIAEVGDEIRVCLGNYIVGGVVANNTITNFTCITGTNYFRESVDGQISYGQTFDIAEVLPNMKQTDFLMGIFKMMNIYIDSLPNEGLVIEPRDDYFTEDEEDWTDKLDVSKDFKIVPQGLLENKELLFSYSNNDDDYSRSYKQSVGYEYGYKRIIFDNDFVKVKKQVDIPFSLCPLRIDTDFGNVNMITLFDGVGAEKSNKPIIAYYGNMKPSTIPMVYWDQTPTRNVYTTYPYAGPIDDVESPSYSLEFGLQDIYYYTVGDKLYLTDNYLYNQFHRTQWQEIGHRDSKLIEGYFKLNADDVASLSFRPKYFIDKAWYRLLGVYDYNPDGKSTTLCKFLKLDVYTPASPVVTTMEGGNGQGGDTTGDILKTGKDGILKGHGNEVDKNTTGVVVTGYGNSVGANAVNIIIQGNNNTIMPGVQNVTLINTDDKVIAASDQVWINGIKHEAGTLTEGYVLTYDSATNTIKLEASSGGGSDLNIDGGVADSVYSAGLLVDGGTASG